MKQKCTKKQKLAFQENKVLECKDHWNSIKSSGIVPCFIRFYHPNLEILNVSSRLVFVCFLYSLHSVHLFFLYIGVNYFFSFLSPHWPQQKLCICCQFLISNTTLAQALVFCHPLIIWVAKIMWPVYWISTRDFPWAHHEDYSTDILLMLLSRYVTLLNIFCIFYFWLYTLCTFTVKKNIQV